MEGLLTIKMIIIGRQVVKDYLNNQNKYQNV